VLGHAPADAPDLLDGGVDAPQRAQGAAVARPVGVREDVVVEVVDVDGGRARVDVARDGQREQLAHPHREADLDGQHFQPCRHSPTGSATSRSTARVSSTAVITVLLSATQASTMRAESAARSPLPVGRFMIANVKRLSTAPPVKTQP